MIVLTICSVILINDCDESLPNANSFTLVPHLSRQFYYTRMKGYLIF